MQKGIITINELTNIISNIIIQVLVSTTNPLYKLKLQKISYKGERKTIAIMNHCDKQIKELFSINDKKISLFFAPNTNIIEYS